MIRRTFVLVCLLSFAACEDDGTGADTSLRYALQTVNGANLPTNMTRAGRTVLMLSGFVQVDSDNTFVLSLTWSETVGQSQTGILAGTWARSGDALTLRLSSDGATYRAPIDGDRITWPFDGSTLVFMK